VLARMRSSKGEGMTHEEKSDALWQCALAAVLGDIIGNFPGACLGVLVVLGFYAITSKP